MHGIYEKLKTEGRSRRHDVLRRIKRIGYRLDAEQRIIATAMMVAHKHFASVEGDTEDPVLCAVSFLLAFKINDTHCSLAEILVEVDYQVRFAPKARNSAASRQDDTQKVLSEASERVQNQELLFCIATNFEFSYTDYYDYLFTKLHDFDLDKTICDTAHVVLNDSFYLPLFLFHGRRSMIYAVLYLALEIHKASVSPAPVDKKVTIVDTFLETFRSTDPNVEFIANEILDLYANFLCKPEQ